MNWDQIESKWAAMTRRVQAEWRPRGEAAGSVPRSVRQVSVTAVATDVLIGQAKGFSGATTTE